MQITIRTVTEESFKVDANPTDTVAELKESVENLRGVETYKQRFIYRGQVLNDEHILSQLNIDPKKFIVLVIAQQENPTDASQNSAIEQSTSASPIIFHEENNLENEEFMENKLRSHPLFVQFQRLAKEHPELIVDLLQDFVRNDPQLLRSIEKHQVKFLEILMSPNQDDDG